jgi:hypothetical protein
MLRGPVMPLSRRGRGTDGSPENGDGLGKKASPQRVFCADAITGIASRHQSIDLAARSVSCELTDREFEAPRLTSWSNCHGYRICRGPELARACA